MTTRVQGPARADLDTQLMQLKHCDGEYNNY